MSKGVLWYMSVLFFLLIYLNKGNIVSAGNVNDEFRKIQNATMERVKLWSEKIGQHLTDLSILMTREQEVHKSFENLKNHVEEIDGLVIVNTLARKIRAFMTDKAEAVQNIAEYAEYLSYHRNTNKTYLEETENDYYFYDADEIVNTEINATVSEQIQGDVYYKECRWFCVQQHLEPLKPNRFSKVNITNLYIKRYEYETANYFCECDMPPNVLRRKEEYSTLPMVHDNRFDTKINTNVSVVKIATNIYERDMSVLEGIRWSEPLDLVFKENFIKDQELVWQYFASPTGFMRHYPAIQWSKERYYQTYDFRTRSWFTEAMTSPKDIVILLDRSGSMAGTNRQLSLHIVNDILDTLNDNDFVNIYTFSNSVLPLVDCFNDTLFQANEENLRLLRENLPVYKLEHVANISTALEVAFNLLADFRKADKGSNCNQAIMLITEAIDYPYNISIFEKYNWKLGYPVRIFTYLVSTNKDDEKQMEYIACSNLGYYVNMTLESDIREKILKYLTVMSRPINLSCKPHRETVCKRQVPIWSYIYVDLADRRLSNWLWTKVEGIRQREVFLDHAKRRVERLQLKHSSEGHMLLREHHEYEKYEDLKNDNYMTTVSMPVYGRRDNEYDLIGVAGVDVPIKLFRMRIPHELLGVNGYAFIITNNGYILMHPEHRREFENIPKPTFNRVDFLETEILDDNNEPRNFGDAIVKLREQMITNKAPYHVKLKIKYTLDNMKRIIKGTRHYYFTEIRPFTLCIVLPDKYGSIKVNKLRDIPNKSFKSHDTRNNKNTEKHFTLKNKSLKVHPDWIYCQNCPQHIKDSVEKVEYAQEHSAFRTPLYHSLMYDISKTSWFDKPITNDKGFTEVYDVYKVFISTSSGLTRWQNFHEIEEENQEGQSIDADWYQRSVEENYDNEDMFIFSVPFEISGIGFENNNTIRGTKAIFIHKNKEIKTPIAVVGLEFNHLKMQSLFKEITTKKLTKEESKLLKYHDIPITCGSIYLQCFILDNNAYILLSDEIEYTGRFIGDIRTDIMFYLVDKKVYEHTSMYDYQATCQLLPPESEKATSSRSNKPLPTFQLILRNLYDIFKWLIGIVMQLVNQISAPSPEEILKEETKIFNTLKVSRTFPTPCDRKMVLFTLKTGFNSTFVNHDQTKFNCTWAYVVHEIPKTNLIFLAVNNKCDLATPDILPHMPDPTTISYLYKDNKVSLPCYIAIKNNYTRKTYMECFKKNRREYELNKFNKSYCGHTWT